MFSIIISWKILVTSVGYKGMVANFLEGEKNFYD